MDNTNNDNDIDALLDALVPSASGFGDCEICRADARRFHAALTALVAERDELREQLRLANIDQFNTEAEANDRDSDLRERLVCAIWPEILRIFERADTTHNNGANWDLVRINARDRALTEADAMIAAMRKEGGGA